MYIQFIEPPTLRHIEQEEQWLQTTGNRLPEESTIREMICGLLLGCFLGILNLFWFKETVFTRRHQMGIVAGMLINVYYGVTHVIH
ncbi:hypothetical protein G6F57_002470 [Rhizopus arrhizus]|uniref:DSC E3 ubiquitin ligase complex subunit 3 C-terminal domain-containing protein n=1 Tax=Rhizopus oryzae TaxID=64495 RepID=A0A9P6XKX4_RHIOR|nr:hypothetical protein G6F24_004147 [Rhizopus arrhizus]KAG1427724.1 hypothetical protein G6F58_000893 [Rhizopus delemar]KAG0785882.1 hypothetical protein G6F22_007803 [Rhizopus arrhizus]KAG0795851.1 hypothetical protein G6F21_001778 [Rhizopus arrhizus]KAG0815705.1 hypothetical protein G6F20_003782 [Rhizopus arrhizus]